MKLERMWINQPSTYQPLHHRHGTNILAFKESDNATVWFLEGDVISMLVPRECLSHGWLKDKKGSTKLYNRRHGDVLTTLLKDVPPLA